MLNLSDVLSKYEIKDLEPSEDRILWRYTDIPSLIEILSYEYLPLIRMSCLSDRSEGAVLKAAINKLPEATDFGKNFVFDICKKTSFVSCWCESKEELAPMWERFAPRDGIAIKTNPKRLLECIRTRRDNIKYVKYIDKSPDAVFSNLSKIDFEEFEKLRHNLYFYKLSDFTDEREVRILQCREPKNFAKNFAVMLVADPTNQYPIGPSMHNDMVPKEDIVQAPITSMSDFIIEIIVSPTARPGIHKVVKEVLKSHDKIRVSEGKPKLDIKVRESRRTMWH